jgi:hypothetical protein
LGNGGVWVRRTALWAAGASRALQFSRYVLSCE